MKEFLENKLHIAIDGVFHVNEMIAIAILAVAAIIVILLVRDALKRKKLRENAIFSHRRNKYKSRLGRRRKNKY